MAIEALSAEDPRLERGVGSRRRFVQDDEQLDVWGGVDEVTPARTLAARGDEHADAAIGCDVANTGHGRLRIEGNVCRSRLERPVDADERLDRLVEMEADSVAALNAVRQKQMGELIRTRL